METTLFPSIHTYITSQFTLHSLRKTGIFEETLNQNPPFLSSRLTYENQFIPLVSAKRPNYRFSTPTSAIKWKKDLELDNVIDREKKLNFFLKMRRILLDRPNREMHVTELGHRRRDLYPMRLRKDLKFISILKKFPGVFEIHYDGANFPTFKMTEEAEKLYLEELKLMNDMEGLLVIKLRKLLMMSIEKRIPLMKISFLKADLGLPPEFHNTICYRYPQFFKVVNTIDGPALELTHWDPALAVSAAEIKVEDKSIREMEEKSFINDRPVKFNTLNLPRGFKLTKRDFFRLHRFRDVPFMSPYSDFSGLKFNTLEKEKHSCGVVHEILSLTIGKKIWVDFLTHFREEFRFSQQLRWMLVRHPEMFYVSLKGFRNTVFLREAYYGSQLMEKDKLIIIQEKLLALLCLSITVKDLSRKSDGDDREEDRGAGEHADFDDWNECDDDDDDDIPPNFDDDYDTLHLGKKLETGKVGGISDGKKISPVPLFPDGRPRECW